MEKPTEAQQKELNKLAVPYLLKTAFNTLNHVALLFVINAIMLMAHDIYFPESSLAMVYVGSVIAAIFFMRRMNSISKEIHAKLVSDCEAILKK